MQAWGAGRRGPPLCSNAPEGSTLYAAFRLCHPGNSLSAISSRRSFNNASSISLTAMECSMLHVGWPPARNTANSSRRAASCASHVLIPITILSRCAWVRAIPFKTFQLICRFPGNPPSRPPGSCRRRLGRRRLVSTIGRPRRRRAPPPLHMEIKICST